MRQQLKCLTLVLFAVFVACCLRFPRLSERPVHGDEAVQAYKFGRLLEENDYRYDPNEYHGPTLNYLTLIPAELVKCRNYSETTEWILRIVPVFFGLLLVLLVFLIGDGLGKSAVFIAALLTAVSPAMVFFSRYYIQEMLLVCFTFGLVVCGYRYLKSKNFLWALSAGICAGLMHATKETCVIAFGSMLAAVLIVLLIKCRQGNSFSNILKTFNLWHIAAAVVVAVAVSALFYSSFFTNPRGVLDSVLTYRAYLGRASQSRLHIHPWYYYFEILIWPGFDGLPIVSEALIVALAFFGVLVAIARKHSATADISFIRFISLYTIIMTAVYCFIPYKTPWCMLSFLQGMILLAGFGAFAMLRFFYKNVARGFIVLLLALGVIGLSLQSYIVNFIYYADPANPYVYAHPTKDIFKIQQRAEQMAAVHPAGYNMAIEVIVPENYWPIPWYLRKFPNVGYRKKPDITAKPAPLIIASSTVENQVLNLLYELPAPGQRNLYVPLFDTRYIQLRPGVKLVGMVTKKLWDDFIESENEP